MAVVPIIGNLGAMELLIHHKGCRPMTLTVYLPTQLYEQRLRALAAWWCLGRQHRRAFLVSMVVAAVLFVGGLAAGPGAAFNDYKSPRPLAEKIREAQTEREEQPV